MAVKFDYAAKIQNVYHILIEGSYTSEEIVNPADAVFFISIFEPGHTGITTFLEYYLANIPFYKVSGADGTLSYKWQYKPVGGPWTDLVTGVTASVSAPGYGYANDVGVFFTPITLPVEIRLIGTDADATWQLKNLSINSCLLRAVGSIS